MSEVIKRARCLVKCISSKGKCGRDSNTIKVRVCFKKLVNRSSSSKLIKDLLDSDTSSLDGRFSKEHVWVRGDPFSVLWHGLLLFHYAFISSSLVHKELFRNRKFERY
jgi:hypothetical protein